MPTDKTKNKPYWEIRNKTETAADLYIYSDISPYGGDTSAKAVQKELSSLGDIKRLNIYINSAGGNVFEGQAIRSILERFPAEKNVYIDGLCASIATVIAFGIGANVRMGNSSLVMIHRAWSFCSGNSEDFEKMSKDLEKCDKTILQIYRDRVNGKLSDEEISEMMSAETWLTADECLEKGFIDDIVPTLTAKACLSADYYGKYKNIPDTLKNAHNENDFNMSADVSVLIDKVNLTLEKFNKRMEDNRYACNT